MITTPFSFAPSFGGFPFGGSPFWGSSFANPFATPFVSPIQSWNKPITPWTTSPWAVSSFAGWPTSAIPSPWNISSPTSPIGVTPWTTPTPGTAFAGPWSWQSQFNQTPWTTGQFGQIPFGQFPFGQFPFSQIPQVPFGHFGQVPFGQFSFGQVPFGQFPFGQVPFAGNWTSPLSQVGQYAPFTGGYSAARNGYTPNGHFSSNGVSSPVGQTSPAFTPVGQFPVGQFPFGQFGFGAMPFGGFHAPYTQGAPSTPFSSMSPFASTGFASPFGYTPFTYGAASSWPASPFTPHTTGFTGSVYGQGFAVPANYPYPHTEVETPVGAGQRDAA